MKEVNNLLNRLGELEDAPLIWINKKVYDMGEEIERLNKGYCELKEKCNKGECDCTHEEYNSMCEANMKLYLEIERQKEIIKQLDIKNLELTTIIKEVREYINKIPTQPVIRVFKKELLEILDKEK